jgi:release factor glutamine methyltransferase
MSESGSSIAQTLVWAADQLRAASDTPRLDAELLLAHLLGWSRARVLAERHHPLTSAQLGRLQELVARRADQEPIAYITGHKEFYGLDFVVDRAVLAPRPETELLVELALDIVRRKTEDERRKLESAILRPSSFVLRPLSIVDLGTGSGAIAIALAAQLPGALIYATDISEAALEVARRNAARHHVAQRVRFAEGDLLDPIGEPVDLIVSNPPYTILAQISVGVRRHEPHLALDGGRDGLAVYRRLLAQAPEKLRPGGAILLEIGATQGAAVVECVRMHFPLAQIDVYRDLAGLDRVVAIETANSPANADGALA